MSLRTSREGFEGLGLQAKQRPAACRRTHRFRQISKIPCWGFFYFEHLCFHACSSSRVTYSSAFIWVLSSITFGATPASKACFHRNAHKHQRSPAFKPWNRYSGRGVMRSFPCLSEKSKNSCDTFAQITWLPRSCSSVLQQPSRK